MRLYTTVHVRDANGVWRSAVAGDFMFRPDFDTSHVTDLPRVRTFATGDGRLHAAWPTLVDGHAGAMAATLTANAGAAELTAPVTLWPATTNVALEDVARGRDGSYAVVWWGVDGPGLTEADAAGAVQVSTDLATERPLRFAKVAIDRAPAACSWCGAKEPRRPATGRSHGRSEVGMSTATETKPAVHPRRGRTSRAVQPVSARRHFAWLVGGMAGAFLVPFVAADQLGLQRDLYYALYAPRSWGCSWRGHATPASRCARCREAVAARRRARRRIRGRQRVHRDPGRRRHDHPGGIEFIAALGWRGIVYGAADGLLLSAFPILLVFAALRDSRLRRRAGGLIAVGAVAIPRHWR